jgi:hypothetical protein
VSNPDLVPTLITLAGEAEVEDRPIFTEKNYHDGYDPIRAVRDGGFKPGSTDVDGGVGGS